MAEEEENDDIPDEEKDISIESEDNIQEDSTEDDSGETESEIGQNTEEADLNVEESLEDESLDEITEERIEPTYTEEEVGEEFNDNPDGVLETETESEPNLDDASDTLDNSDSEDIIDSEDLPTEDEVLSDEVDEQSYKKSIVEGALFVAGRPISIEEIHIKSDLPKKEIQDLVEELAMDYMMRPTALEIVQIQDKYSLQIKPEYTPKLKKFATGGLIPDAILKTLTIIALKQPIMKSMLVKLRGSTAYEHVKYLNENGYISLVKKGRSSEISTSDQFADMFGLSRDKNELKKQMIVQLGIKENQGE